MLYSLIMKRVFPLLIIIITVLIIGCRYDKEEDLYPQANGTCAPGTVTYSGTMVSLMSTYACVTCHHAVSPAGNITVTTYNGLKTVALNGRLYGSITHANGYIGMPLGSNKMSDCDIAKVKAWIDAGAPNN